MRLRILIAPDSFKGCMSASAAAEAMALGAERAAAEFGRPIRLDLCPMSDGGEGFADALRLATMGRRRTAHVLDAAGREIDATWTLCGRGAARQPLSTRLLKHRATDAVLSILSPLPAIPGALFSRVRTAAIESAQAIGLAQLEPDLRRPRRLSSFGVGQLLGHALEANAEVVIVGLGGSATCDGGIGMAQALGVRFELIGEPPAPAIEPGQTPPQGRPLTAADLPRIRSVNTRFIHPSLAQTQIVAAHDVDNPLCGGAGAAAVFAPQKGASDDDVRFLDAGLRHLADVCLDADLDADPDGPGAGAAGGLGFGLMAFCGARAHAGATIMARLLRLRERARRADLVLTGEGRLDAQTARGKVCLRVAEIAARAGVPTVALVGATGPGWQAVTRAGGGPVERVETITPAGMSHPLAVERGAELLENATMRVVRDRLSRVAG